MVHHIPENLIEDIRSRTDILEVVSAHVLLKKSGKNYKGLCPFHSEKTPSFTVSPDKQIYHCFGCGAGGNAFKFLMEMEDLPFLDVVRKLASRTGVVLPAQKYGKPDPASRERELLLIINQKAAAYFTQLLNDEESGRAAREYLQSRDFHNEALLTEYGIGWATPGWRDTLIHLQNREKCSRKDIARAGLIKQKEGGSESDYYDRFRSRIIFPLKDIHSNLIGFAGRTLDGEEPKYLNSPETSLYIKGKHLYGLNLAREAIRKENRALLVEGYFDQIRAHQHGIRNTVATCGTALTLAQAGLLKNHTRRATLIFDGDSAGASAAERGFEVLLETGLEVEVLRLPAGHDPDSYISEFGPEKFRQELGNARPFVESYIMNAVNAGDLSTPAGKTEVVNRVLPILTKVKNSVERTEWMRVLTERAAVNDKALLAELKNALRQDRTKLRPTQKAAEQRNKQNPELYLVQLMLANKELAIKIKNQVSAEEFEDPALRRIIELFYNLINENRELRVDHAIDYIDELETKALLSRIGVDPIPFDNLERTANDCIRAVKKRLLDQKITTLKHQRNEAVAAGKPERSRELENQLHELRSTLISGRS